MSSFSIDVSGCDEVYSKLFRVKDALSRPGMEKVGEIMAGYLRRNTNRAFSSRSDPVTGKAWEPLKSERYIRELKARGETTEPTLKRKRHLKNSLRYRFRVTASSVQIQLLSRSAYARVHMEGGGNHIDPRPYTGLSDTDVAEMRRRVMRAIADA